MKNYLLPLLLLTTLCFMGCPEEPKSCSYNRCAPGCPSIPECEDEPENTDAGQTITLTCSDIDKIGKDWGGSTGPCGPHNFITVTEDGNVTESIGSANPPEGETECADPVVTTYSASPANARTLINTVCEDYNTNYEPPENSIDGAYAGWGYFQGDDLLASAAYNLAISSNALDSFMGSLTPNQPTETTDGGVTTSDGGN